MPSPSPEAPTHLHRKFTGLNGLILETPDADYRWRWIVTPADAETIIRGLTHDITYSNFKSTAAKQPDQSAKLSVLHDIWGIHHGWQDIDG